MVYYENEYFSICIPENLSIKEETIGDSIYEGQAITVYVGDEAKIDKLRIESDGYSDSGPLQCLETQAVSVSGFPATRYIFKEESQPCGEINYIETRVEEEPTGGYLVGYHTSDLSEFIEIEQSLQITKK